MASGAVLDRMRQLYAKADAEVLRWAALQVRKSSAEPSAAAACMLPPPPPPQGSSPRSQGRLASSSHTAEQEQSLSLLGTIANIAGRLPAVEDPAAYGALAALPAAAGGALQQRLLAKQLAALEALIEQLQEAVEDMQASGGKAGLNGLVAGHTPKPCSG